MQFFFPVCIIVHDIVLFCLLLFILLFFLSSKHGSTLDLSLGCQSSTYPHLSSPRAPFLFHLPSLFSLVFRHHYPRSGPRARHSLPSFLFFFSFFALIGVYAKTRIVCDVSCRVVRVVQRRVVLGCGLMAWSFRGMILYPCGIRKSKRTTRHGNMQYCTQDYTI